MAMGLGGPVINRLLRRLGKLPEFEKMKGLHTTINRPPIRYYARSSSPRGGGFGGGFSGGGGVGAR